MMCLRAFLLPFPQIFRAFYRSTPAPSAAEPTSPAVSSQSSEDSLKDHFDSCRDAALDIAARLARLNGGSVNRRIAVRQAKSAVRAEWQAVRQALVGRQRAEVQVIRARVTLKHAVLDYRKAARKAGKLGPPAIVAQRKVREAIDVLKKATDDLKIAQLLVPRGL